MPLISIEKLDHDTDTRLAVWRITEDVDELFSIVHFTETEKADFIRFYKSPSRQKEILAVRVLLEVLFSAGVKLSHDANGCPFLSNGYNISITHTKDFAAVIVSKTYRVSVDMEFISARVLKVKEKFLRSDEYADTLTSVMLHWCAKETVYKLYSGFHLALSEMRVNSISDDEFCGIVHAENLRAGTDVLIHYRIKGSLVLTFACV